MPGSVGQMCEGKMCYIFTPSGLQPVRETCQTSTLTFKNQTVRCIYQKHCHPYAMMQPRISNGWSWHYNCFRRHKKYCYNFIILMDNRSDHSAALLLKLFETHLSHIWPKVSDLKGQKEKLKKKNTLDNFRYYRRGFRATCEKCIWAPTLNSEFWLFFPPEFHL